MSFEKVHGESSGEYRLLVDEAEENEQNDLGNEDTGNVYGRKKHVFVVEKRLRVYSLPDYELTLEDDGTTKQQLCEVDYTQSNRVVKKFRKGYANWRKGGAKGAKGELNTERLKEVNDTGHFAEKETEVRSERSQSMSSYVPPGTESFANALMNSLNYNLGLSILGVPYFFSQAGWLMVPLLILSSLASWVTGRMLGTMMKHNPRINCYADICFYAFSGRFGVIAATFVRVFQITELFTYFAYGIVLQRDMIGDLVDHLSQEQIYIIIILASLPFVFLTSYKALSMLSTVGVVAFCSTVGLVFQRTLYGDVSIWNPQPTELMPPDIGTFFRILGSVMLLFAGHAVYPSLYYSLANKEDYQRVVDYTFFLIALAVLTLGAFAYLTYGGDINPLVVLSLEDPRLRFIATCACLLKTYCSQAMMVAPIVREIEETLAHLIADDEESGNNVIEDMNYEEFWFDENKQAPRHMTPLFRIVNMIPDSTRHPAIRTAPLTRNGRFSSFESGFTPLLGYEGTEEEFPLSEPNPILIALARRRRESVMEVPASTKTFAFTVEVLIRICIIALDVVASFMIPSIEMLMALIGAVFSVQICFTFPGILYCCLYRTQTTFYPALLLVILGLTLTPLALVSTL